MRHLQRYLHDLGLNTSYVKTDAKGLKYIDIDGTDTKTGKSFHREVNLPMEYQQVGRFIFSGFMQDLDFSIQYHMYGKIKS